MAGNELNLIADLPSPLGQDGKTWTANVYGIAEGKRQKRPEVAVAIDGGCINIYDIKSTTLLTGYAVPPQSTFMCPPLSIRIKAKNSQPARRLTYCATKSPKPIIQLFTERPGDIGSPHPCTSTKSRVLPESQSPVILLDTIFCNSGASSKHFLLCVHGDGQIGLLSDDLDTFAQTPGALSHDLEIVCAKLMTIETAQQTVFSKRGDLGARLKPSSDTAVSRLLLILSKGRQTETHLNKSPLTFRLFNLFCDSSTWGNSLASQPSVSCEELLDSTLVVPEGVADVSEQFYLDERTGDISHRRSTSFTRYKFDGRGLHVHEQVDFDIPMESYLQLESTDIAISSGSTLSIINTTHKSLLSRQTFCSQSSKYNRDQSEESGSTLRLCSYFSKLQMMVAMRGRSLVTVSLERPSTVGNPGRKRRRDGSLVDSIGRGWGVPSSSAHPISKRIILQQQFGTGVGVEVASQSWDEARSELQTLSEAKDSTKFDHVVMTEFKTDEKRSDVEWDQIRRENSGKFQWIISNLFHFGHQKDKPSVDESFGSPTLKICFLPLATFRWLVRCNALSSPQVELALKAEGKMPASTSLTPDALISAFAAHKEGSRHLSRLVASKCLLTPHEVSQALRYALDRVENAVKKDRAGVQSIGDSSVEVIELPECSKSLNKSDLSVRQKVAYTMIQNCLRRLQSLDARTIQQAFKKSLTTTQLLILVDCLRLELARGGWLSQFVPGETPFFQPPPEQQPERLVHTANSNEDILIITKLLNCTLDALGTTSWITAPTESAEDNGSNMLTYMKAEVSAALEGIEEAAYLEGILAQILLYSQRAEKAIKGDKSLRTRLDSNDRLSHKTRTINWGLENSTEKVLHTKKGGLITQDDPTRKDTSLPLDLYLNGDERIGDTKIGTGGVVEKMGVRDKEHLRRQQVGEYRFERIII